MSTEPELRVYTVGHSNHPLERLLELLARHEIGCVVDVRSTPYSRHNPQYNREPLAKALEDAGLRYVYDGNRLGGAPTDPTCYVRVDTGGSATRETEQVDYRLVTQKDWFQEAVDGLVDLARTTRVALLCAEEDPDQCHRHHLVTPALVRRNATVLHIRGSGEAEPAKLSAEARQLSLF